MNWAKVSLRRHPGSGSWTNVALADGPTDSYIRGVGFVRTVGGGALGIAGAVIGGAVAVAFIALMLGGGVYRTECSLDNGVHTKDWGLEGEIPYLWSPNDSRCQTHTLTRYVLGKVGAMADLDQ